MGAVAQRCGEVVCVWGGGGSCVGKLLGGATHVAGLLHSFIGELCGGTVCVRAGLGELWRGGGGGGGGGSCGRQPWGLGDPVSSIVSRYRLHAGVWAHVCQVFAS